MRALLAAFFMFTALWAFDAAAVCSTPDGAAGDVIYETNNNVVQYCDGTNWQNTGKKVSGAGTSGCTDPVGTEGEIGFNSTTGLMQFCNGDDWINMACSDIATTGGGGCSTPDGTAGDIIYNSSVSKLQFCDSTNWLNTGSLCLSGGATVISYISTGDDSTTLGKSSCALVSGRIYCWGDNTYGELGDSTTTERSTPTEISGGFTDWTTLTGGADHTCALRAGRAYCWGRNNQGQLGDSTTTQREVPTEVDGSNTDWTHISASTYHTCGIRGGIAYCWGRNNQGQLGKNNNTTNQSSPIAVTGSNTDWTDIEVGDFHSCGINSGGRIYCWGSNTSGQFGNADTASASAPRLTVQTTGSSWWEDWDDVAVGSSHSCGIRGGLAYCWGTNTLGQLGLNNTYSPEVRPALVSGGYTDWTDIEVGADTTCALRAGRAYCWGRNSPRKIGDGTTTHPILIPTEVDGGYTDWTFIKPGGTHTCGVRNNTAYCWGTNTNNQLSDGTTTERLVPTAVVGLP